MGYWLLWIVMLAVWEGVHMEVILTQRGSEIKRPSESVQLTCATSGFVVTNYYMSWVRQKPGKGLEWLVRAPETDGQAMISGHKYTNDGSQYQKYCKGKHMEGISLSCTLPEKNDTCL
ncbi:UNVERIFIED_CONTAM: hypothetical protein K2H54_044457 [Gekko kuhli]